METQTELTPRQKIEAWAVTYRAKIIAEFVPFSRSRNRAEKSPSLNWRVTVHRVDSQGNDGRGVLVLDYSAGCGHCPAYKASVRALGHQDSLLRNEAIRWECEHGYPRAHTFEARQPGSKALMPDPVDVLAAIAMDCDALDEPSFEDWAESLGYDRDSRKAEAIYRTCLEYAVAMRAAFGGAALDELRKAAEGLLTVVDCHI